MIPFPKKEGGVTPPLTPFPRKEGGMGSEENYEREKGKDPNIALTRHRRDRRAGCGGLGNGRGGETMGGGGLC
uniref:Uncharacterized protein n=1 Tax=viral metagenome TaxID=1070528 RepID=A0A6H1ZEI3_9ZZZZ